MVLCTWNGARWLPQLLRSLARQRAAPDELVVQDDASDDRSVAVVEEFASNAPFPVRLERNDVRVGSTRNFGIALARAGGEVLALADQDDVWFPDKLARLGEEFAADPTVTMVFSDAVLIGEDGREIGPSLWGTRGVDRTLRTRPVVGACDFARRPLTTGCTMAVRRRAVEAALPLPDELDDPAGVMRHDRWLSLVAAAVGTVRALPEPLLGFRVHPAQETGVLHDGPSRRRAMVRTARHVASAASTEEEHEVRARQLSVAAHRADDLGDFESARALRRLAEHHRTRAAASRGTATIQAIATDARRGHYGSDVQAAGAVAADLLRLARHHRR